MQCGLSGYLCLCRILDSSLVSLLREEDRDFQFLFNHVVAKCWLGFQSVRQLNLLMQTQVCSQPQDPHLSKNHKVRKMRNFQQSYLGFLDIWNSHEIWQRIACHSAIFEALCWTFCSQSWSTPCLNSSIRVSPNCNNKQLWAQMIVVSHHHWQQIRRIQDLSNSFTDNVVDRGSDWHWAVHNLNALEQTIEQWLCQNIFAVAELPWLHRQMTSFSSGNWLCSGGCRIVL